MTPISMGLFINEIITGAFQTFRLINAITPNNKNIHENFLLFRLQNIKEARHQAF